MTVIVNGEKIESGDIDSEFDRLKPQYDAYVAGSSDDAGDEQLRQWAKETVIERTLVLQEARARDEEIPESETNEAYEKIKDDIGEADEAEVKKDIELQLRVDRLMAEHVKDIEEPSEQELKDFYEENKEQIVSPPQVRASHVVKHVQSEEDKQPALEAIKQVKAKLDAGEPFEKLAREHSDCPDKAGDLDYFPRGQMVQEFDDVVFNMKIGDVSDIFFTQFGYHIAKVHDRVPQRTIPFENVRDQIAEEVMNRRRTEAVEKFVDSLRERAKIEETEE